MSVLLKKSEVSRSSLGRSTVPTECDVRNTDETGGRSSRAHDLLSFLLNESEQHTGTLFVLVNLEKGKTFS